MFEVILIVATIISFILYFIPSLIAAHRKHHNTLAIFVLNLFLGWSFLGWVVSCIWACTTIQENTKNKTKIIWLIMIVLLLVNIIGDVVLYNYLKNYTGLVVSFNKLYSPIYGLTPLPTNIDLFNTPIHTKFGNLYAQKESNSDTYNIYYKKKLILKNDNSTVGNFGYYTKLADHDIVIFTTDPGGSIDNATCTLIDLYSGNRVDNLDCNGLVRYYTHNNCIYEHDLDFRPYADRDDYELTKPYCLDKNDMTEYYPDDTTYAKSDNYYTHKFSNYTSKYILQLTQSENSQCFDPNTLLFVESNACSGWRSEYCFMYHAIKDKDIDNNQFDNILYKACSTNDFWH